MLTYSELGSDYDKSEDVRSGTRQRRASTTLVGRRAFSSHYKQPQRSCSLISDEDEDEDNGTLSSLSSNTRSTLASGSNPRESQLFPQAIDIGEDWEVRQIIGKEEINGSCRSTPLINPNDRYIGTKVRPASLQFARTDRRRHQDRHRIIEGARFDVCWPSGWRYGCFRISVEGVALGCLLLA